jgi:hypothetical protein
MICDLRFTIAAAFQGSPEIFLPWICPAGDQALGYTKLCKIRYKASYGRLSDVPGETIRDFLPLAVFVARLK